MNDDMNPVKNPQAVALLAAISNYINRNNGNAVVFSSIVEEAKAMFNSGQLHNAAGDLYTLSRDVPLVLAADDMFANGFIWPNNRGETL